MNEKEIQEKIRLKANSTEEEEIITHLLENNGEGEISEVSNSIEYRTEADRSRNIEIDKETGYMELNRGYFYELKSDT